MYQSVLLKEEFHIRELYRLHYFEYMKTFSFDGEAHDFWEFCYVDKGEVEITADSDAYTLQKGDVIFHKPNEFHTIRANGICSPNLLVVSFACSDKAINFFANRILKINVKERDFLGELIIEARNTLDGPLNDPYLQKPILREESFFASQQLICLYLEQFLISLYRRYSTNNLYAHSLPKSTRLKNENDTFHQIIYYLEQNLSSRVTIENICTNNMIGRTQLQKLFHSKTNRGIIEFFSHMKIDAAKQMIRDGNMNFTQIAEQLGYASIHYFSRQFKKIVGMTPSEYASSIKVISERV